MAKVRLLRIGIFTFLGSGFLVLGGKVRSKIFSSEAIVLSRKDFSDSDRIVSLYSRDFGKQTLIAKGAKKVTSKKRASLEVFSLIKFSAAEGKSMGVLLETEIIEVFPDVRQDLNKVSVAYYFLEVVDKTTKEGEKNPELFEFLLRHFQILTATNSLRKLRLDFAHKILVLLGFWPFGADLPEPDRELERVLERQLFSPRVGKRVLR